MPMPMHSTSPRPGWGAILFASVLLAAALVLGLAHSGTPALPDGPRAAAAFSAGRALVDLRQIARAPHATGTPANDAVRAFLVARLQALGLETHVQDGIGVMQRYSVAGKLHNIVARLPGRGPGPALLLAAHYDSAPTSFGAADDGASVAALLETVRALRTGPALERDVIVLITDGEEAGLLGARLFTAQHPLARQAGLVLNFEYRGNAGPLLMFETSAGNGPLVQRWLQTAPAPMGNSLMYEVYKRMPNGTDFSIFRDAGLHGLNFAAIGGSTDYHTALDRIDRLAPGTLQRQGDTMLALARGFSQGPLVAAGPDRVYFDAPVIGAVSYPGAWAVPLALAAALLCVLAAVAGCRRAGLRAAAILWSMPAFVVQVLVVAAACQALWWCVRWVHPQYKLMLQGDPYNASWYLAALALLGAALFLVLSRWLRRWLGAAELALGALACWTLGALATAVLLPGASFLFVWPGVFLSAAWLLAFLLPLNAQRGAMLQAAALFPAALLVIPIVALVATALTLNLVAAPAVLGAMLLGLAGPALMLLARLPLVAAAAGVACLAGGALTAGFDIDRPQPYSLYLALDANAGRSYWLSNDAALAPWVRSRMPGAVQSEAPGVFGSTGPRLWVAPAAPQTLAAPVVSIVSDQIVGANRHVDLVLRSPRSAPKITLAVDGAPVLAASVDGQVLLAERQERWRGGLHGFCAAPVRLTLQLPPGQAFTLRVADVSYDLCAAPGMACPPTMLAQPFGASGTIQAVRSTVFQP
jgi:hypothetical protein